MSGVWQHPWPPQLVAHPSHGNRKCPQTFSNISRGKGGRKGMKITPRWEQMTLTASPESWNSNIYPKSKCLFQNPHPSAPDRSPHHSLGPLQQLLTVPLESTFGSIVNTIFYKIQSNYIISLLQTFQSYGFSLHWELLTIQPTVFSPVHGSLVSLAWMLFFTHARFSHFRIFIHTLLGMQTLL